MVLVVGGEYLDPSRHYITLASAELYDPTSGRWTTTGSLSAPRARHTATLLPNGQVLVAGGQYQTDSLPDYLSSAELYDPATGQWTTTASLAVARDEHTATLLPNGTVLVVGGFFDGSIRPELYDPTTGQWTTSSPLSTERDGHTATLLSNGHVLIVGGYSHSTPAGYLSSAELYDPATGQSTMTGSLSSPRDGHTATLLPNGMVLVVGGFYSTGTSQVCPSSAELYDPATGLWTTTASTPRFLPAATLLSNGKALVVGGEGERGDTLSSAELYDPVTGQWATGGSLSAPSVGPTATLLSNGKVLVVGGDYFHRETGNTTLSSAELYDPAAGAGRNREESSSSTRDGI